MGVEWNPSWPLMIGVDRRDAGYSSAAINSQIRMHGLQFQARHSGATSNISLFTDQGTSASQLTTAHSNLFQPIMLDLYPASGAPWVTGSAIQVDTFTPTAVTGSPGMLNENLSSPITASRLQGQTDGSYIFAVSIGDFVHVQFDTGSFPLNRRIRQVCLVTTINAPANVLRLDSGVNFVYAYAAFPGPGSGARQVAVLGEAFNDYGTSTWSWWTPQLIRDFRSGGPRRWGISCISSPGQWILDYVQLQVYWEPERRIGVGIRAPNTVFTETSFDMKTPATTGTPSLTSGQQYALVCRRPEPDSIFGVGGAVFTWRRMNGSSPVTGWTSVEVNGQVPTVSGSPDNIKVTTIPITSPTPSTAHNMSVRMVTGGPAGLVVETTQPYQLARPVELFNTKPLEQVFTVHSAAASGGGLKYGQSTALISWDLNHPPRFRKISAEVSTVSGAPNIIVLSKVDRVFEDIEKLAPATSNFVGENGQVSRLVRFRHPETTLLAAGQYKITFTAQDTPSGTPWYIETLIGEAHTTDQTFQRAPGSSPPTTGYAVGYFNDGTTVTSLTGVTGAKSFSSDLQCTIAIVPPPVTGFEAAVGITTAHHAENCARENCLVGGCSDQGAPFNQLSWSAAASTTLYYEVQRFDEINPIFRTIAFVRGRFNTRWADYEARIGVRSCYRVRSVHPDTVASDWSAEVCSTPPVGQVALTFTSNAATGLAVTYPEVWNGSPITRSWTFQEYDGMDFREIHGRNGQAMFHRIERTGITFSRTLLLNALCTVRPPSINMFSPLRVLSWAPIPYVCVRDGEGNRWFAAVQVPTGTNIRGGEQWYADVVITQLVDDPAVVDTDVAQPEDVILA